MLSWTSLFNSNETAHDRFAVARLIANNNAPSANRQNPRETENGLHAQ